MLVLSRCYGERIVLFNKITKEQIGLIKLTQTTSSCDDATLIFEEFDGSIGIYRKELYERYKAEAKALETLKGHNIKERGLLEFIAAYEKGGRVAAALSNNIGNK